MSMPSPSRAPSAQIKSPLTELIGEPLFCYGTLRHPLIMEQAAGAEFPQVSAILNGYACYALRNEVFPGAVAEAGAQCVGVLYWGLSCLHLQRLDFYEGPWYERQRVEVQVEDHLLSAWGYVLSPLGRAHLARKTWSFANFVRRDLAQYVEQF